MPKLGTLRIRIFRHFYFTAMTHEFHNEFDPSEVSLRQRAWLSASRPTPQPSFRMSCSSQKGPESLALANRVTGQKDANAVKPGWGEPALQNTENGFMSNL